jgi:polysaccharide biosynthesis transport protein
MTIERRMQSSEYARSFLDQQIKETKSKLEESERALNDYAKKNSILTLDEKTNVISQTYTDYSTAFGKVEQERLRLEAQYAAVAANPENAVQVSESKTVQAYKEQKTKYETEYMNNLPLYKPDFPKMVQLKAQINELDSRIKAEANGVLASLRAQLDAVKRQEDQVRARLQDTRHSVLASQDKGVDYNLLKRELDTNRQMYDSLLQRMKEVSVTSGVASNNVSVVDEAKTPSWPIAPNLNKSLSVGLLSGLVLGVIIALIRENLDDSIKRAEDVEAKLSLPLLGIIPLLKKKQFTVASLGLLSHVDPRGLFAEAYRSTRTALQFSTAEGAPKRLMVTSSVQGEGKSTTALSLAINFAQMGQKVLIIDADMRSPTLHNTLSRSNEFGLSAYLSGDANREALIQDTDIRNLAVLVAGPHPPSPVDLLIGPRFMELLDRAEAMGFDRIVIDAPPVLGIADAIVLGNQVQNILFAIKSASTKMSNIRDALRRMRLSGLLPLGVVLTSVSPVETGYDTYGYGVYGAENAKTDPSNQLAA